MSQLVIGVVGLALGACSAFEDNATHLADLLEKGAKELRRSSARELVVHYEPLEGLTDDYEVNFVRMPEPTKLDLLGNVVGGGGGYLVVTGSRHGGTSYHERFVFVPRDLRRQKHAAPMEILLRKSGDQIEVVELR